ncbi:MAG: FAD-dependent oxidoreductase [Gammaproteobacteria bacterium]|nr:FAD-dependent oxidoreductase [Gammaproteobacteria bacterium]
MQKRRLASGGIIDRDEKLYFGFNGRQYEGYAGDSLASALLANDLSLIARSIRYHRPRGILSAGLEEPNALVNCADQHGVFVPNLKATEVKLTQGLEARSQNCWPDVTLDIGALLQRVSALLSAGFYYKTFMWPQQWWHRVYEKLIRRAAGQGRVSTGTDLKRYDRRNAHCDLLIIGSGPAGLGAALAAVAPATNAEISIMLLEQDHVAGGSTLWERCEIDAMPAWQWREQALASLAQKPNIRIMCGTLAFGQYDHGQVRAIQRVAASVDSISWRIRAKRLLLATGATENPLVFPTNDRPGIMLASAVRHYIHRYAVVPGRRALLAITDADEAGLTHEALESAGIEIVATLQPGEHIVATYGLQHLSAVDVIDKSGQGRRIRCDLLCVSAGWNPNAQLLAQLGAQLDFEPSTSSLLPPAQAGITLTSGACRGLSAMQDCMLDGRLQAQQAITQIKQQAVADIELPEIVRCASVTSSKPVLSDVFHDGRGQAFVDLQNDVTRADLEQAVSEGYDHVELAKRYTTTGMGTDQGKTSWVNAIREMTRITGQESSVLGHTTFRPPCSPVSIGALVGADVNRHMAPLRQTPFHRDFAGSACVFQTSGDWLYSRHFPLADESMEQAIRREVLAVRSTVGCVDMSTLGKIDIKGEDALEFLTRIYCNNLDGLEQGRLRYALMLREDGILFDDGTVSQLGPQHYLVTTTTANSAAVWRSMNKLAQLRWPSLDVQLTSVSDHWASLAIAGPKARALLAALNPDFDVEREHFPYASVRQGSLGGIDCRVFSVSFSGELSYEINVPAGFASALYQRVLEGGVEFGITPYGLEALDVLRIEKGHLSVGSEIDGRTTPADLGLGKLVSTRKAFIGSSLLQRPALQQAGRLQLVGLTAADGQSQIPPAAHICEQTWQPGQSLRSQGKLSAAVSSPTLGYSIALALLENGQQRWGEKLWAVSPLTRQSVEVVVGASCFIDPDGSRVRG